jgi:hypothetical protein
VNNIALAFIPIADVDNRQDATMSAVPVHRDRRHDGNGANASRCNSSKIAVN